MLGPQYTLVKKYATPPRLERKYAPDAPVHPGVTAKLTHYPRSCAWTRRPNSCSPTPEAHCPCGRATWNGWTTSTSAKGSPTFSCGASLRNRRHVEVTERRTKVDWAHVVRDLEDYPRRPSRFPHQTRAKREPATLATQRPLA